MSHLFHFAGYSLSLSPPHACTHTHTHIKLLCSSSNYNRNNVDRVEEQEVSKLCYVLFTHIAAVTLVFHTIIDPWLELHMYAYPQT